MSSRLIRGNCSQSLFTSITSPASTLLSTSHSTPEHTSSENAAQSHAPNARALQEQGPSIAAGCLLSSMVSGMHTLSTARLGHPLHTLCYALVAWPEHNDSRRCPMHTVATVRAAVRPGRWIGALVVILAPDSPDWDRGFQ